MVIKINVHLILISSPGFFSLPFCSQSQGLGKSDQHSSVWWMRMWNCSMGNTLLNANCFTINNIVLLHWKLPSLNYPHIAVSLTLCMCFVYTACSTLGLLWLQKHVCYFHRFFHFIIIFPYNGVLQLLCFLYRLDWEWPVSSAGRVWRPLWRTIDVTFVLLVELLMHTDVVHRQVSLIRHPVDISRTEKERARMNVHIKEERFAADNADNRLSHWEYPSWRIKWSRGDKSAIHTATAVRNRINQDYRVTQGIESVKRWKSSV